MVSEDNVRANAPSTLSNIVLNRARELGLRHPFFFATAIYSAKSASRACE